VSKAFLRRYELTFSSPEHIINEIVQPNPEVKPTFSEFWSLEDTAKGVVDPNPAINPLTSAIAFDEDGNETLVGNRNFFQEKPQNLLTIPAGIRQLTVDKLHFTCSIEYSSESKGSSKQQTTFKIYNLSKDKQKFIRTDCGVNLKAGYEQPVRVRESVSTSIGTVERVTGSFLPLIFSGQVIKAFTEEKQGNTITTIVCADSNTAATEVKISKQYSPGVSYAVLVKDLMNEASKAGIPVGHFIEDANNRAQTTSIDIVANVTGILYGPSPLRPIPRLSASTLANGYIVEGNVLAALDEVCENIGYRSYLSLGKLYVEPKSFPKRIEVVEVREDHIKGGVKFKSDGTGKTAFSKDANDGVLVNLFLNGEVSLDKDLLLYHDEFGGLLNIVKVVHKLSYEGGAWDTTISARRVN
jgi:hypothetical protein